MRVAVAVVFPMLASMGLAQSSSSTPKPIGKLIDLGGYRLHIDCRSKGSPTVIIENAFDEFSFDWRQVQTQVGRFTRICTYDRAGYAWSDPGPAPRTFAQMNLELHRALAKLGERGPLVVVGHAFGGPIARNFATTYPKDVAGLVLVDAISEDQRFEMWKKAVLMRDGAQGKAIPLPHEDLRGEDKLPDSPYYNAARRPQLEPPFDRLPPDLQKLHLWAQSQRTLAATEENERTWSPEYFAIWHAHPEVSTLGEIRLIVLSREQGGFRDLDIPATQQEAERKSNQLRLAGLSKRGEQRIVASGEAMQVEAPDAVVQAIRDVVETVRKGAAVR
jgi:pimeloyl-ACP methyl ester carboxylesterase